MAGHAARWWEREIESTPSTYGGLLRYTCKWIAGSVGFRFRPDFGEWKRQKNDSRCGASAKFCRIFASRFIAAGREPGVCFRGCFGRGACAEPTF
jgi:hypothetical protein